MITQRLTIDPEVIKSYNITLGEFLFTLSYMWGFHMEEVGEKMLNEGKAKYELNMITPTKETVETVRKCLGSDKNVAMDDDHILTLAKKLKSIYPKGYNSDGTPWAEGPKLIAVRLESFFRKYGNYPEEDILSATKTYVDRKFGTPYFRLLRNFIYKESVNSRGEYEPTSDLYSLLETGAYDTYTFTDEWTTDIV